MRLPIESNVPVYVSAVKLDFRIVGTGAGRSRPAKGPVRKNLDKAAGLEVALAKKNLRKILYVVLVFRSCQLSTPAKV